MPDWSKCEKKSWNFLKNQLFFCIFFERNVLYLTRIVFYIIRRRKKWHIISVNRHTHLVSIC